MFKSIALTILLLFSGALFAQEEATEPTVLDRAADVAAEIVLENENVLKQAMASVLTGAMETAGQAKDFILEEMPIVIQQLLYWKFAEHLIYAIMAVLMLIVSIGYWIWYIRQSNKHWDDWSEDQVAGRLVIGGVATAILTISALNTINIKWLMIWVAPKIYLIEYAAELVKTL